MKISDTRIPKRLEYRVIAVYAHDPSAFTQGLAYDQGYLFEGTGLEGMSSLRQVKCESGEAVKSLRLPASVFGEGVTVFKGRIFQLTWKEGLCFVYDLSSFKLLKTLHFSFCREGWGLTHDGSLLIASDGSPRLYFVDPETLACTRSILVQDENGPVYNLNELEYCRGRIFANIWQSDVIVVIDPHTGKVLARIDCSALVPPELRGHSDYVLNGIAYDGEKNRFFVTGKMWPKLYVIEISE